MIGLGCGARSYTTALHYADEYAVRSEGVRTILEAYIARPAEDFSVAVHGFHLDGEEQRRRHVLASLLQRSGLALNDYTERFGSEVLDDLPQLRELEPAGLAQHEESRLLLTDAGLERSDAIGPWLYTAEVRERMEAYTWR
jgi:oxygen-independent coproporphyrinogen-3 oxidase